MERLNTLAILLCLLMLFGACSSSTDIIPHEQLARDIKKKTDGAVSRADSILATIAPQASQLGVAMRQNTVASDSIAAALPAVARKIEAAYAGPAREEMLSKLTHVLGRKAVTDSSLSAVQLRMEALNDVLTPAGVQAEREALIKEEMAKFIEQHGDRRMKRREKERLADRVTERLLSNIGAVIGENLRANEELRVLHIEQNSILFELRTMEANLKLTKDLWKLNMLAYFATGSARLTPAGEQALRKDVNTLLDSLGQQLASIVPRLVSDSLHRSIQLKLFVDGYADTQGFRKHTRAARSEANLQLSQQRAEVIHQQLQLAIDQRVELMDWLGLNVLAAVASAIGHGEALPSGSGSWEPEGRPDSERRVAQVQVTFSIQ